MNHQWESRSQTPARVAPVRDAMKWLGMAAATSILAFASGCADGTDDTDDTEDVADAQQPSLRALDGTYMDCGGGSVDRAPEADQIERDILNLTNAQRAQNGLPALQNQGCLGWIAYQHSENVKANRVKPGDPHTDLNGDGPYQRLTKNNIAVNAWAENIFYDCRFANGQPSFEPGAFPQRAIDWWMSSPGHRANILRAEVQHIGIGVAKGVSGGSGCYWATQLFLGQ